MISFVRPLTKLGIFITLFICNGCDEKFHDTPKTEIPLELQFEFFDSPKDNIINGVIFGDNVFAIESLDTLNNNHLYYFGNRNSSDGAMIITDKGNRIVGYITDNQVLNLVYLENTLGVYFTENNNTEFYTIQLDYSDLEFNSHNNNYATRSTYSFLSSLNNLTSDFLSIYGMIQLVNSPNKLTLAGVISDIAGRLSNNRITQNSSIIAGGAITAVSGGISGIISVFSAIYSLYQNETLRVWFGNTRITIINVENIAYGEFRVTFNIQDFNKIGNTSWLDTKCVIRATQQLMQPGKISESEILINSDGNYSTIMSLKEPDLYEFEVRLYRVTKYFKNVQDYYMSGGKFTFAYNQLETAITNLTSTSSNQSLKFNLDCQMSALSLIDRPADNQLQQIERGIYFINEGEIITYPETQFGEIDILLTKDSQNNNYFNIDLQNYNIELKRPIEYGGYILNKGKNGNNYYSFSKTNPEKLQLSYNKKPSVRFFNIIPVDYFYYDHPNYGPSYCSVFNINYEVTGAFFIKDLTIYTFGEGWEDGSDTSMQLVYDGFENLYISQVWCPADINDSLDKMFLGIKIVTESGINLNSPNYISYVLDKGNTRYNGSIFN